MWQKWKGLKTGEKVLFSVVGLLIVVTLLNYAVLEWIRRTSDKPMFQILTHYDFAGEGFRGSELFRKSNCTSCHRAVGNGTSMGLNLDGIGSRHDLAYLEAFLRDPEGTYIARTVDHGLPPKEAAYVSRLPADDRRAIAIFLSQLKADRGGAAAQMPPAGKSTFIDAMLDMWVPDSWRIAFRDIRTTDTDTGSAKPAPKDAGETAATAAAPAGGGTAKDISNKAARP